jgi:large subunit ribosomal protein L10
MPETPGELCLAFSDDLIAPARNVYNFQKKFDKKISIMGGVFDGSFKNAGEMMEIAMIPSLDVLRGMFVNVINSPIQGLVLALNAIAEKKGSN